MSIRNHYNVQELVVEAIDTFNARLAELNAHYRLKDDPETIKDNYNVYFAKKKNCLPKDDYPRKSDFESFNNIFELAMGMDSLIRESQKEHFALCCFTSAFAQNIQTAKTSMQQEVSLDKVGNKPAADNSNQQFAMQDNNMNLQKEATTAKTSTSIRKTDENMLPAN